MQTTDLTAIFGPILHSYTRAQAIDDGVLADVSETATEAGIRWPVALTAAAWTDCVAWDEETEKRKGYTGQSTSGRLWDVVWMLSLALRSATRRGMDTSRPLFYELVRTPREGRGVKPRPARLKFIVGPDDNGRPCITVMLPGED
ncbi:DUF6573 family protein [Thiomonas intermedia]|uniref:DUF6573 family protein n=1 Tax=Thiomonas intermedia TaxID=926 RepID=UPI0009A4E338|nr:DUF6573 family protein [Thiomonas intermedia]